MNEIKRMKRKKRDGIGGAVKSVRERERGRGFFIFFFFVGGLYELENIVTHKTFPLINLV